MMQLTERDVARVVQRMMDDRLRNSREHSRNDHLNNDLLPIKIAPGNDGQTLVSSSGVSSWSNGPKSTVFRAYRAAAANQANGWQTVLVDTVAGDIVPTGVTVQSDIANSRGVIQIAGYYQFNGSVGVPLMAAGLAGICIQIGGTQRFTHHEDGATNAYLTTNGVWLCAVGDTVLLQFYNSNAGAKALDVTRTDMNMLSFSLVHAT